MQGTETALDADIFTIPLCAYPICEGDTFYVLPIAGSDKQRWGIVEKINNTMKTKIVIEIVHAMNYIHKKGLIHRDLKIENIMLNSVFEAKIVDFGLAKIDECFNLPAHTCLFSI